MQKISATMVSLTGGSGYSKTNARVGLTKDMILSATNAVLISDNNPDESTARIVDIQIGNSQHYIRIYTVSSTSYFLTLRDIANSNDLVTTRDLLGATLSTKQTYNFTLMYSDTGFYFGVTTSQYIGFAKMTNEGWTAFYGSDNCYLYNIDTRYTLTSLTYGTYAREDGKEYIIPVKVQTDAFVYYNADFCSCLYSWANVKSLSSYQLLDNEGTLWQRVGLGSLLLR